MKINSAIRFSFVFATVLLLMTPVGFSVASEEEAAKSDSEIRRILIRNSIRSYSGSCPCPYSTDRAGRRCGKRSAYSRPGGASPLCYERDVSQSTVDKHRERNNIPKPQESDEVTD